VRLGGALFSAPFADAMRCGLFAPAGAREGAAVDWRITRVFTTGTCGDDVALPWTLAKKDDIAPGLAANLVMPWRTGGARLNLAAYIRVNR
jgi:hypothetical protein